MNNYYVYAYLRKSDNTPYYIGKGKDQRAFCQNHSVSVPKDKTKIIFYQKDITEEDAFYFEAAYIKLFGRKDNNTGILLNRTDGGDGSSGFKHSEESKIKISHARKGIKFSEEHRLSMSIARKKRPPASLVTRSKISLAGRGRKAPNKGKTHSEQTKFKMSIAMAFSHARKH